MGILPLWPDHAGMGSTASGEPGHLSPSRDAAQGAQQDFFHVESGQSLPRGGPAQSKPGSKWDSTRRASLQDPVHMVWTQPSQRAVHAPHLSNIWVRHGVSPWPTSSWCIQSIQQLSFSILFRMWLRGYGEVGRLVAWVRRMVERGKETERESDSLGCHRQTKSETETYSQSVGLSQPDRQTVRQTFTFVSDATNQSKFTWF